MLLVLFFVAVNAQVLFFDSTLKPHGRSTPTIQNAQNHEVSKSFTADVVGTTALFEFDQFAFHEISKYSIPYWNPYTLLGIPFLAEYQWGIFYPPNYMRILLPEQSWDYYSYFHILLLAIIVYFLAKSLYRDRRGAFVASISVFCTGFFLSYLPTHTIINVIPWGFLLILSIEGLIIFPRDWSSSLGVTLAAYCLGTAGHPTLAIFMTMGALLFFAFRMLFEQSARRAFMRFALMSLVGGLLAAPNIGPFLHYVLGSEGSVVTQWWEKPPFYSLRHFASFIFPYLFGSINDSAFPSITSGMQPNSGFFWGVPPTIFLAFLGIWFAAKNRSFALLSLALSGLVLSLWGFGIPPISLLSSVKALTRLNPSYVWSFPAVVICLLAGYGVVQLRKATIGDVRTAIYTYTGFIVLMLTYVIYLGRGLDRAVFSTGEAHWALLQGLIPGVLWSAAIVSVGLISVSRLDPLQKQHGIRSRLTWIPIIFAIGLSGVGYFPSGDIKNHAIVSMGSVMIFILLVLIYVGRRNWAKKNTFINSALIALLCIGGWSSISSTLFTGLPNRYVTSVKPDFIGLLSHDRLNWRSYGIFGEILTNALIPYRISTINNQNAIAPIELRQFFHDYLDSYQDTTMFYGVKYNTAADGEPMNQFHIHRKFWDYVGTKYILSPSMLGDARRELNSQINGYEAASFEGAHPTGIPIIEAAESPASMFLTSKIDCSRGAFSALRIKLSTYGLAHSGLLYVNIFDAKAKLLATSSINAANIGDNEIYTLSFGHDLCGAAGDASVTVGLGLISQSPHALAAWYTRKNELIFSRVYSQSDRIRLITRDDDLGVRVYENAAAMPRAYTVTKLRRVNDWHSAQVEFSKQQNLRDTAFVEEAVTCPAGETKPQISDSKSTETAEVTSIESSEIQLQAQVSRPAVLVLVDTFAPGWTAKVDNVDVPLFRVNGLFRGICLAVPGSHRISMSYRPPYWKIFTLLPILGVLILALLFFQNSLPSFAFSISLE
ncbi:MAG: hypothetical protein JWR21_1480 [Herminiimonas sp.]|nr:hypothetical protein [Herminiimonas sp.]